MRRTASLGVWCTLVVVLLIANPVFALAQQNSGTPAAGNQAGQIDRWRVQAKLSPSVFGPQDGTIVQDPNTLNVIRANAQVRDFYTRATFTNPQAGSAHAFDYGFLFRVGRDASYSIAVDSRGGWFFDYGGQTVQSDSISGLNVDAGGKNDLELAVVGGDAYLAVNGDQVAAVDVSNRLVPGDVAISTAFTTQTTSDGAKTPFSGYQVWSLDGLTKDQAPPPDPAGEQVLTQARAAANGAQPMIQPASVSVATTASDQNLSLQSAGVKVDNFYLKLTPVVPDNAATQPWDIGIGFRDTGQNSQYRLTIASDGTWYFSQGTDPALQAGAFTGLKTDPKATNEVEVAASGNTGALAINGNLVATLDLKGGFGTGDIWLASGLYSVDAGTTPTTIQINDVMIWDLGGAAPAATTPEASATAQIEPTQPPIGTNPTATTASSPTTTTTGGNGAATFQQLMSAAQASAPIADINAGAIKHDSQKVFMQTANVNVRDFAAHVVFTNPYPTSRADWDYGFEFRLTQDTHYRLYVTSRNEWQLTLGANQVVDQGKLTNLDTSDKGQNTLDMVANGDQGYFAVNGQFIAALDISGNTASGDVSVATAFLEGDFQQNASTTFSDFKVWPLTAAAGSPSPASKTEVPPAIPTTAPTQVPATAEASPGPANANTYTSPTYGYTMSWSNDWKEVDHSSKDGTDALRLDNSVSTVDLYGYPTSESTANCVDGELNLFQTTQGYSNAKVATDASGNALRQDEDGRSWGVFNFTYTDNSGQKTDYTAYVECRPIEVGQSMVLFIQFVPADQYDSQQAAGQDLLSTLTIGGAPATPEATTTPAPTQASAPTQAPAPTQEATTAPTAEATRSTTTTGGQSVTVQIAPVNNSGISGLATLTGNGDQTDVKVLTIGAQAGAVVLIQQGTCDNLNPTPAQLMPPLDAAGSSSRTVPVSLDSLRGGYSITIHTSLNDLAHPAACGAIPGA
jgi:hypothetical protein